MFLPDWQPITVDLPTEWEFATKNKDSEYDRYYLPDQHITIWEDLTLYAIWESV